MHLATATNVAEPKSPVGAIRSTHFWPLVARSWPRTVRQRCSPTPRSRSIASRRSARGARLRSARSGSPSILAGDDRTADATLAEADRASIPPAAASGRALALAYRATIAIERGDWAGAAAFVTTARDVVLRSSLSELALMSLVFALAARVAIRRGNRIQAASDQAHANRLRAGLSEAVPWLAVGANARARTFGAWRSPTPPAARTLLREADDILRRFPSFGRLADDAVLLREQADASASVVIGPSALTAAELRLLPYLSTYLSFREIGERVGVSANTIKSQTMSIYRKLDVSSRGDAIARAAAVGLTDPLRDPGFCRDAGPTRESRSAVGLRSDGLIPK